MADIDLNSVQWDQPDMSGTQNQVQWTAPDMSGVQWDDEPQMDPLEGMSAGDRRLAGVGRGFVNTVRGARELGAMVGDVASGGFEAQPGVTPQQPRMDAMARERAVAQELDAPLMGTPEGQQGNVLGMAATLAPTVLIPGAATLPGASLVGATAGFVGTPGTVGERMDSAKAGAVGGAAGQVLGRALGAGGRAMVNRSAARGQVQSSQNAVRDATMQEGMAAGYTVSPAQTNPTAWNRLLEGIAGKLNTQQGAAIKNQSATNNLARKAIGIRGDGAISAAEFDAARAPAFAVYSEVSNVSPDAAQALQLWRQANHQAGAYRRFYNRSADPKAQQAAEAASTEAQQWHQFIEQEAVKVGRPDLAKRLSAARVDLGRIGTVENATAESTGDVSAHALARAFKRGDPLTGELRTIGRFSEAFPKQTQTVNSSMPGVSPLDASVAALGAAASGSLKPLAAVGVRPAVRGTILSRPYQNALARPQYGPSPLNQLAVNAMEDRVTRNALSRVFAADGIQE